MFDYGSSTDLFSLKSITEVLVRTAWQPKSEDAKAAAEGKALIFQFYRAPIP